MIMLLSACSTTKSVSELPPIPIDASPQEAVNHIAATCGGFAKSGAKNGHGSELEIFNDCMNKAIAIIEKTTKPTT